VMEKGKWMFNSKNQTYYEESYITKCQNEVTWIPKVEINHTV
jgi:hypothetical protein